jgi:hypothetical protein
VLRGHTDDWKVGSSFVTSKGMATGWEPAITRGRPVSSLEAETAMPTTELEQL